MTQEITTQSINYQLQVADTCSLYTVRGDRERFPHMCDVSDKVRCEWLYDELVVLYSLKHQSPLVQFVTQDAATLSEEIMKNSIYRELTFYEVSKALRNGAVGRYGESKALTVETLLGFIGSYFRSNVPTYKDIRERKLGNHKHVVTDAQRRSVLEKYKFYER